MSVAEMTAILTQVGVDYGIYIGFAISVLVAFRGIRSLMSRN